MGKLSIKNLKFHEDMSEETPCFSVDVYQDGKLIAHVSNTGQGGSNDIHPAKGLTYKDVMFLDNLDTEAEIFRMVEEMNIVKKKQSNHFVLKKDGGVFLAKQKQSFSVAKKYGNYAEWVKNSIAQFKAQGYEVLNTNL